MECLWFGNVDGTFFNFDAISKCRKITHPMLPDDQAFLLNNNKQIKIPIKGAHEIRILSIDIALMASTKYKNDASAIFINQLTPTKNGRYLSNIVYASSSEGLHTLDQALQIRRLYDIYCCDYIVIDVKGVGFGVADALLRDISDPESGEVYPALSCYNNKEWAARCATPDAPKALWVINGTERLNSDCAILLRDGFSSGKIRLLTTEYDGEIALASIKGYSSLSPEEKLLLQSSYINTTNLIKELINLQHDDSSGLVKISQRNGMRKDRYSSLSYSYWVACQLENELQKRSRLSTSASPSFCYRAPKVK